MSGYGKTPAKKRGMTQEEANSIIPPLCSCGKPCLLQIVKKEGPNKGREFWTCSARLGEVHDGDKTFVWADGQPSQKWVNQLPNRTERIDTDVSDAEKPKKKKATLTSNSEDLAKLAKEFRKQVEASQEFQASVSSAAEIISKQTHPLLAMIPSIIMGLRRDIKNDIKTAISCFKRCREDSEESEENPQKKKKEDDLEDSQGWGDDDNGVSFVTQPTHRGVVPNKAS